MSTSRGEAMLYLEMKGQDEKLMEWSWSDCDMFIACCHQYSTANFIRIIEVHCNLDVLPWVAFPNTIEDAPAFKL